MHRTTSLILVAVAALLIAPTFASADILIDDFDFPNGSVQNTAGSTVVSSPTGASRTINGTGVGMLGLHINSALNIIQLVGEDAASVEYEFTGAGLDLTGQNGFVMNGALFSVPGGLATIDWFWETEDRRSVGQGTWLPGDLLVMPQATVGAGSAPLGVEKTLKFTFAFDPTPNGDLFFSGDNLTAIPEPSSISLCGIAMLGMGIIVFRARRRRQ